MNNYNDPTKPYSNHLLEPVDMKQILTSDIRSDDVDHNSIHHNEHDAQHTFELSEHENEEQKCPIRTSLIAITLLVIGLICLSLGIYHFSTGEGAYFAFFLLGSILIIPGGYQSKKQQETKTKTKTEQKYPQKKKNILFQFFLL
jgi:hypothetical protein